MVGRRHDAEPTKYFLSAFQGIAAVEQPMSNVSTYLTMTKLLLQVGNPLLWTNAAPCGLQQVCSFCGFASLHISREI